jgi:hypothetical protein
MKKHTPEMLQKLIDSLEKEFANTRDAEVLEILRESKRQIELLSNEADDDPKREPAG